MGIRPTRDIAPRIPDMRGILDPKSSYVPLSDVAFAPAEIVMPHELPPQTMPFPTSWFQYLSGAPSVQTIYDSQRKHVVKF